MQALLMTALLPTAEPPPVDGVPSDLPKQSLKESSTTPAVEALLIGLLVV